MSKWEKFMLEIQTNIKFYDWYEKYYNQCNVISKQRWVKEDKTTVASSHPPLESIIISHKKAEVIACPFKIPYGTNDTSKVIQQNNFTNQYLAVIGKQLDKIETSMENHGSDQRIQPKLEKPLINLPSNRK